MDNRRRLDFHGERRIWDGHQIEQKIEGNSALYIYTDEVLQLICHSIVLWATNGIQCLRVNFFFRVNVYLLQSNLSRTATLEQWKVAVVKRWPLWGGRGVIRQNFCRDRHVYCSFLSIAE